MGPDEVSRLTQALTARADCDTHHKEIATLQKRMTAFYNLRDDQEWEDDDLPGVHVMQEAEIKTAADDASRALQVFQWQTNFSDAVSQAVFEKFENDMKTA